MRAITLFVLLAASALAQKPAPPAFEVASVKINQQEPFVGRTIQANGGSLTIRNVPMRVIAAWAYNLQWSQIAGPAWIDSDRFDILAKSSAAAGEDDLRLMLQTLLAQRFRMVSHRETRQVDVLALTVPKSGHKMIASKAEKASSRPDPVRGTVIEGVTLAELCENMSHDRDSIPIVDMTGLTGRFDFAFNIQKYRDALRATAASSPRPISEGELKLGFTQDLLAGELGLKVDQRKAPVEFFVIDQAEQKPIEN